MVELYPAPFHQLLHRIFEEYEREGKIFDLPKSKFFCGEADLDTSVILHGERAATPVGPAAGPQSQLAQNIILSWLAGSRIIELKTVQINDELKIPRPCIDAANVGYNVEWSQELKLDKSLKEYVAGSMLIEIMRHAGIPGPEAAGPAGDAIFDMSVGYDLEGIRSPQVRRWMAEMRDASAVVEELRQEIPNKYARFRDIDFKTRISNSITLSTFHGCPANEIERIVEFLLEELDVHTIIKMNPTLLGREAVEHLLHDVMGYRDVRVTQEAFDKDLQFDQALEICDRLSRLAEKQGKRLGAKFSNTLVVTNHKTFFTDETMYLSGAPLHVITLNLAAKFREAMPDIPISFSAGVDQINFPDCVAQGFVPVTTCTDLLRPGGYGRLPGYLSRLQQRMRTAGTTNISDFVIAAEGCAEASIDAASEKLNAKLGDLLPHLDADQKKAFGDFRDELKREAIDSINSKHPSLAALFAEKIETLCKSVAFHNLSEEMKSVMKSRLDDLYPSIVAESGLANTRKIVSRTTADARYGFEKNKAIPRKIGSKLWLYDCINCDKCIPVCPNDANFAYELSPIEAECSIYSVADGRLETLPGRSLKIGKTHQIGNFADFCNECGNCDVFCPEDGGPYIEKPRFFGTLETMKTHSNYDGCCFERSAERDLVHGRFKNREYLLTVARNEDEKAALFSDGKIEIKFDWKTGECKSASLLENAEQGHSLDSYYYFVMKALLDGVLNGKEINYINIAFRTDK